MNWTKIIISVLSWCFVASASWGQVIDHQAANAVVRPTVRVGDDLPQVPHVEPVIAVNPHDPDHLVVASIVVEEPFSETWTDSWRVHVLVSRDGGSTWMRHRLPALAKYMAGDPWLVWASNGALYLSCLADLPDEQGKRRMRVLVFQSENGGESWSEPIDVFPQGGSYDHPVLSVTGDSSRATAYVFATGSHFGAISVSRSYDGGAGFSPLPYYRPDSLNNNLGRGVGLSDGRLVFSYFSMSRPQPSPLWAVHSSDGGQTYQRTVITSEHIPVGFPMMAVDRSSGPRHGRIYSVWTRSNAQPDVMLAYSDDAGTSWSKPVRVHADPSVADRIMPNVAVNSSGIVMVAWVDGRNHEGSCWDLYASASLDGGSTFLPEDRLTPEVSCPDFAQNGGAARRWRWGGDYRGITTDATGAFYAIWSDTRTGVYQMWMTKVVVQDQPQD